MRGNLFHKGPNADNSIAVAYGQEGLNKPVNTLEMVHNTIVMTRSGGTFITAAGGTQSVKLTANLLAGTGSPGFFAGGFAVANIVQLNNLITAAGSFPSADNITAPDFWPTAALQSKIGLPAAPDATYSTDSPKPFLLRSFTTAGRQIGAVQAAP
jgi:hypothetical protein